MGTKKNKIEFISEEKRNEYLNEIIGFFKTDFHQEIGFITAGKVLDYFVNSIGEDIYKKAIDDVRHELREKMEDLDIELEILSSK